MVIEEGDEANYVDDYHEMELVFANTSLEDSIEYTVFDSPILNDGSRIKHPINNLEIYVISHIKMFESKEEYRLQIQYTKVQAKRVCSFAKKTGKGK